MSEIGMSTSCFYPLETEKSLEKVGRFGIKTCEIFINAYSELDESYKNTYLKTAKEYGINIVSVHTIGSVSDSFNYFSDYYRRFEESQEVFRRQSGLAGELGAKYIIMHGLKAVSKTPDDVYCERFSALLDIAMQNGVQLLQENVVNFKSQTPEYIDYMKKTIGDKFAMVLDIKQARRANVDPFEFIDKHHEIIKHIHISDYSEVNSCITPLSGKFDFTRLFSEMKKHNYEGDYIIELYEHSYSDENEIAVSAEKLKELLKRAV